jgi:hypothetical protein
MIRIIRDFFSVIRGITTLLLADILFTRLKLTLVNESLLGFISFITIVGSGGAVVVGIGEFFPYLILFGIISFIASFNATVFFSSNGCVGITKVISPKILGLESLQNLQYGVFNFSSSQFKTVYDYLNHGVYYENRKPFLHEDFSRSNGVCSNNTAMLVIKLPFLTCVYINDVTLQSSELTDEAIQLIDSLIKTRREEYDSAYGMRTDSKIQTWMK